MVKSRPGLGDSSCVGQHANGAVDGGKLSARDVGGFLVVDTELEASRAPIDKVEAGSSFEGCNSSCAVAGNHIATVE